MTTTQGRRLYAPDGDATQLTYMPGDYAKDESTGWWFIRAPKGSLGTLRQHTFEEHEDGSITVSPSIVIDTPGIAYWHGWLERGVWREA